MSKVFPLKVATSNNAKALTNRVYVNSRLFKDIADESKSLGFAVNQSDPFVNLDFGSFVFMTSPDDSIAFGDVALNVKQRTCGSYQLRQDIQAKIFIPNASTALASISLSIDILGKKEVKAEIDSDKLSEALKIQFNFQVFALRQQFIMDFSGTKFEVNVDGLEHADIGSGKTVQSFGQLCHPTDVKWRKSPASQNQITIKGNVSMKNDNMFKKEFNFEQLGIGGLDEQFKKMFRTAFASRMFPGVVKEFGVNHVRGILLYGPPGCGKTLIARQIGKVLNSREPKIVNGPEILDKFVGGSEEKIRELFAEAEKEQNESGDNSMLHIIIFDEMDAIMKQRGSTRDTTGVGDSVVNQLLSKIDGVNSLNNVLIIGMTNRKDLIDEAILRPGRLEIHIEVSLPDEKGRLQILNIKTSDMRKFKRISQEVIDRLPELAHLTKNFTGAELEGLVRSAVSFALSRGIDGSTLKASVDDIVKAEWHDFERALTEVIPAFGNSNNQNIQQYYANGIYNYGLSFDTTWETLKRLCNQVKISTRTPLMTVLLEGARSTGKTAIAAKIGMDSDFPFVRMITADSMIGYNESMKCSQLLKIFSDSYRSPLSVIIIDDIERIMEYTPVGPRFSNTILQTLLILLKKVPSMNSRLFVIATTSIASLMEDIQITQAFNAVVHVNEVQDSKEVYEVLKEYPDVSIEDARSISSTITQPIGIKQLLVAIEMARNDETGNVSAENFIDCLHTIGY